MRLSFLFPAALWLLLLLIPLWALALAVPRLRALPRTWISLGIRTLLVAALVLALAGARVERGTADLTTVFLLDRSASIAPAERARGEAFVRAALAAMPHSDRGAVVTFGANAMVERAPSDQPELASFATTPITAGTNLQDAIDLGLSLLPAETNKRLVLLSDGGENAGSALQAAQIAATHGVPLSYVDLSAPQGAAEALISELHAPSDVRVGQSFEVVAAVESSIAQAAHLRVFGDGKLVAEQAVQFQPGLNRFPVKIDAHDAGAHRYRAEIGPAEDTWPENNAAEAVVQVAGPPKVLIVVGAPGEAKLFREALDAAKVGYDAIPPAALPTDLSQLGAYDAVALINTASSSLPPGGMEALRAYVHDLGKGLLMSGGGQTFGVGGYRDTPIEQALPVYMDAPSQIERPNMALVFVLDKSSSMSGCHCRGPNRASDGYFDHDNPANIDFAKLGVQQTVAALNKRDTVGVVTFDENAALAFPMTQGPTVDAVMAAIRKVKPKGATNIAAGLQMAGETLDQTNAGVKHIILFTDGLGHGTDPIAQAQTLRQKGITLSVVGEGLGAVDFLQQIAQAGGGRYLQVRDTKDVPQIFLQEAMNISSKYIVEHPFTPRYAVRSPILAGLESGLPPLYGYNGTTPKQTATLALVDADGSPILAQWQYGLGRAIAWTSDVQSKWAKDWVRWPEFPRFAAQMIGWVLPTSSASGMHVDFRADAATTQIEVTTPPQPVGSSDASDIRATIVGPDGARQELELAPQDPNTYRGSLRTLPSGTYAVQVAREQGGRVVDQTTAALVVSYSPEYRLGQSNRALLDALAKMTGGGELVQPAAAFAPAAQGARSAQEIAMPLLLIALALLPLDIILRRLMALSRAHP